MLVKDLMKTRIITVSPDLPIEDAAREMERYGISCLLVDEASSVLGVITERDLLTRVIASGRDPKGLRVREIMTTRIITVSPYASLDDACNLMIANKIKKLPVVDPLLPGEVQGIISLTDIAGQKPQVITLYTESSKQPHVKELLRREEGMHLEFKSSLRFDSIQRRLEPKLEFNCLKTICAFMNAEGGELLIGINDRGRAVGLMDDYRTFSKSNRDAFENYLTTQISNKIGDRYLSNIRVYFPNPYGREICRVNVSPSNEPAFLQHKGRQFFFVRTCNASRPFNISDSTKYIMNRWPDVGSIPDLPATQLVS